MSAPMATSQANPFPGLRPFREDEEHLFFGRENQVDAMVNKLADTRFLAVVGTSGSGKSSLVNCGLRPALRQGLMARAGSAWRMAQFRPGSDPIGAMSRALAEDGVLFPEHAAAGLTLAEIIETTLRMSKLGLIDICEQAALDEGVNLLVVVDQFEELFRYRQLGAAERGGDQRIGEEAAAFVNLLLEVKERATCPIFIVLTMRSDFLGDCTQFPGLAEAINAGQYLVPRMTRDERRAAIGCPVGVGGAEISPVLLTRLVNDVGDNPDQLSILQHALNRTWARWQNEGGGKGPLDLACYEAIGTMAHALDQHAERAYAELGSARQQQICERLFKALTDKATDPRGVRRPTKLGSLCALTDATAAEVTDVIDVFRKPSRSFLMPPAGEALKTEAVIDISHESLMRVWQRLNKWADDEARSAQTYRRLAETSELHSAGKASLLGGVELQVALDWRDRNQPNQTWAMQYRPAFEPVMHFLEQSKVARDQQIAAERRRKKRARLATAVTMFILIGAVAAFSYLWYVTNDALKYAESQKGFAETARSQRLAALAEQKDADYALLLSIVANDVKPTVDARSILLKNLQEAPQGFLWLSPYHSSTDDLVIAFSHDGQRLVSGSTDGIVMQWDVATRKPLGDPLRAHGAKVTGLAFNRDDRWLAAGISDGSVILWDMKVPKPAGETLFGIGSAAEVFVAFSSDDQRLIARSSDHNVIMWDVTSRKPLGERLHVQDAENATAAAFSPDGRVLALGRRDGRLTFWDLDERKPKGEPQSVAKAAITAIAFHPKGGKLALGHNDGSVIWWDVAEQKVITSDQSPRLGRGGVDDTSRATHPGDVLSLAFSPNGGLLASSGKSSSKDDGSVILWNAERRVELGKPLRSGSVRSVAFGSDQLLAAVTGDGRGVVLWDVPTQIERSVPGRRGARGVAFNPNGKVLASGFRHSVAFSPDGKVLAGADDNAVILWDVASHKPLGELLIEHKGPVASVAFSPDGKVLASGADNAVILWNVASHKPLGEPLIGHKGPVVSVAFSPDGKVLASGADNAVVLWDVAGHKPLGQPPIGHTGRVVSVAFSPDGRLIAVATPNGTILWDVAARKSLGEPWTGHQTVQTVVWSVAFSPDGKMLASGSEDEVTLWDVASHKPKADPFTVGRGTVNGVAFSPDGQLLAIATSNQVSLWDVGTGTSLGKLPTSASVELAVADRRQQLLRGNPTIWDVDPKSWRHRACAIANRNLSPIEWRPLYGNETYQKTCPSNPVHHGWIEMAQKNAKEGKRAEAESLFEMVNTLEPNLHLDPKSEVNTFTVVGEVAKLFSSEDLKTFAESKLQPATTAYHNVQDRRAQELILQQVSTKYGKNFWNDLCWQAALRGHAKSIMFACEYAVSLEPTNGGRRDSRGVARVLTGDFTGAIEDFQALIDEANRTSNSRLQEYKAQRERWIATLRMGQNPLTPDELKTLENQ